MKIPWHSQTTNENLIMKECPYCQGTLVIDGRWQECEICCVCFAKWDTQGFHIKWERKIGEWAIALNLYPEINKTVLTAFHSTYGLQSDNPNDPIGHTEIMLDLCLDNITPQNCVDKIKFMLVWQ